MNNTYWNNNGKFQQLRDTLGRLLPPAGPVPEPRKNRALEKFRKANICYWDLHNNGLLNRANEFRQVFGIASSMYRRFSDFDSYMYALTESRLDEIIIEAAVEQKQLKKEFVEQYKTMMEL